jgi:hypothetical protein
MDPVVMSAQMQADLPSGLDPVGTETLGGVETTVLQHTDADGTIKIWRDSAHHLIVKAVMTPAGGAPQTAIDLTGIHFDAVDPAALTPPANCTHLAGESNANGGHVTVPVTPR